MSVSEGERPPGAGADLALIQDKATNQGPSQALSTREQNDFIPEELLQVLISTARGAERPDPGHVKKTGRLKDGKVYVRPTDPVWHHPLRRTRFKHLTEQPVCVSGAGRDISFLCDALVMEKKNTTAAQPTNRSDKTPRTTDPGMEESLLPSEFYIVKNKGVLGLEYYEDKYTTLLEDDEKRLCVFPSMKPSGRAEVIQLMRVMDAMLKQAGVDEEDLRLDGPTPIHNLLELLKTEQNIYNVVFHELIRQVSVECAERGELLAKIRQRYVMLLNKIPRQVLSLYNDLLAQRALDRSLTKEIIYFKNSIGDLTEELCQVREHDRRVSKDAKQAQAELAKALSNAKKNANLLEEYRELYELQRGRLERQLLHLTEERDLWSAATYRLARKVIEENGLQLARRLYMSEKTWTKIVRHFLVLLASNDAKDLCEIQQITERWRDHVIRFQRDLERSEESGREKLQIIRTDLKKWRLHFQENVFVDWRYHAVPEEVAAAVLQDVKNWENMLAEEQQRFEGNNVLSGQESLNMAADIHKEWSQLGEKLLKRHEGLDGSPAPEKKTMEELNTTIEELGEQHRRRVEGENGVAKGLASFSNSLNFWSSPIHPLRHTPNEIKESDWSNLHHLLPEWTAQAERILELTQSAESEDTSDGITGKKVDLEDVLKRLQHWVLSTTNGTERDDLQLTQQVTDLHTAMVQYLVNALMLLSPDYSPVPSDSAVGEGFEEEGDAFPAVVPLQQMKVEALALSEKLLRFSDYMIKCCQEMEETNPSMEDHERRQLQSIQTACNEWIETCRLLLSKMTDHSDPLASAEDSQTRDYNTEDSQTRGYNTEDSQTRDYNTEDPKTRDYTEDPKTRDYTEDPQSKDYTEDPQSKDYTEDSQTRDYNTEESQTRDYIEDPLTKDYTEDPLTKDYTEDSQTRDYTEDPKTRDYNTEDPKTRDYNTEDPKTRDYTEDPQTRDYTEDPQAKDYTEDPQTKDYTQVGPRVRRPQGGGASAEDFMRIIDYDGNISKKSLKEEEISVIPQGDLTASRPGTPRSIRAFQSLASLEQLEKRLIQAELRAQKAEERSESLEEELKGALQRIREMEAKSSEEEETKGEHEEPPAPVEAKSDRPGPPAPPKKRPKSTKSKPHK